MTASTPTPQADNTRRSRWAVATIVALILGGTLAWNAWDLFGTEGLDPDAIKQMAKRYETTCMSALNDTKACKRHIGRHHRACLSRGVDRAKAGEPARELRYDSAAYEACMEEARLNPAPEGNPLEG